MKKVLVVAAGLAVLSTGAYASKARVDALQNSFLVTDTRDILTNPADLNNMKNFAITEWGANSDAEGGFFKDAGRFAYGFYFGDDNTNSFNTEKNDKGFLKKDNTLSLFFAGDMGVQWGARLDYATSQDEINQAYKRENSAYSIALGANWKDLAVNANIDLKDEAKSATTTGATKFEGKLGYNVEAQYSLMGFDLYGNYQMHGYDLTDTTKKEYKETEWALGVGKTHEVAKTARLFTDAKWTSNKKDNKIQDTETTENTLVATVGYEADATSWLVLRGAISQELVGYQKNKAGKKATNTDSTMASAGATLNFGQLKLDGMIGNTTVGGANDGILHTDTLMTKVAVHYWF